MIESCEHCNPEAEIPFDYILDRITGADPSVTDLIWFLRGAAILLCRFQSP